MLERLERVGAYVRKLSSALEGIRSHIFVDTKSQGTHMVMIVSYDLLPKLFSSCYLVLTCKK